MPRPKRADEAGGIYHDLNRGNARCEIFCKAEDYEAFARILAEGMQRYPCVILSYQRPAAGSSAAIGTLAVAVPPGGADSERVVAAGCRGGRRTWGRTDCPKTTAELRATRRVARRMGTNTPIGGIRRDRVRGIARGCCRELESRIHELESNKSKLEESEQELRKKLP